MEDTAGKSGNALTRSDTSPLVGADSHTYAMRYCTGHNAALPYSYL